MPRRSQRHRSTSLPYRYRNDGIEFELTSYRVDEGASTEFDLKAAQTTIDLTSPKDDSEGESDWEQITIHGDLRIPPSTIEAVFPTEEREAPPGKLYVTVRCHETIYRDRVTITEASTTPGSYAIDIPLRKDTLRGSVELRPYLVRTDGRESDGSGYASEPNFRVASGTIYTVVLDHLQEEEPPAIDGEHVNFSQAPHLPDGEKLYYLDFRNERRPKLWINADHPRISEVLQSRGSVGAEARMRDVILDQISYGVWMQLVIHAGNAIDESGETTHEWQRTVLEIFARNMYQVDDVEEAMVRFRDDLQDAEQLPHLMRRLDNELQEYIDPRTQLIHLMEEGLSL